MSIAELTHGAWRATTENQNSAASPSSATYATMFPSTRLRSSIAIAFEDLAIGVTALQLGFDIATLNIRHFERIPGLKLLSL